MEMNRKEKVDIITISYPVQQKKIKKQMTGKKKSSACC